MVIPAATLQAAGQLFRLPKQPITCELIGVTFGYSHTAGVAGWGALLNFSNGAGEVELSCSQAKTSSVTASTGIWSFGQGLVSSNQTAASWGTIGSQLTARCQTSLPFSYPVFPVTAVDLLIGSLVSNVNDITIDSIRYLFREL